MTALNEGWFTEVFQDQGTAFSLQVKRKLHEEQTPFQKLEIYETETFGNLMVLDGCVMLSELETATHRPLVSHTLCPCWPQRAFNARWLWLPRLSSCV